MRDSVTEEQENEENSYKNSYLSDVHLCSTGYSGATSRWASNHPATNTESALLCGKAHYSRRAKPLAEHPNSPHLTHMESALLPSCSPRHFYKLARHQTISSDTPHISCQLAYC